MNDFRARFTKWYYRKGYRMEYHQSSLESIFHCPLWVRPLVYYFFSPSVYYREVGYDFSKAFQESLNAG